MICPQCHLHMAWLLPLRNWYCLKCGRELEIWPVTVEGDKDE